MTNNAIIKKIKRATFLMALAAIIIAAVLAVIIANIVVDMDVRYVPDYPEIDLSVYSGLSGGDIPDDDYNILFRQTGLGKDAVDSVFRKASDPVAALKIYQENYFDPPAYKCYSIGIVTSEERLFDDDGKLAHGFTIADVRDGDIFITKGTHSVGWRHGHAAIVIDAEKGRTLEAVLWGWPTEIQSISKWSTYPTFIQLRLKNGDREAGAEAARIALENLLDVDYGLLTGFLSKYTEHPRTTQCAHLPWYAYKRLGYDIDSNGGWLVTPKDIANSNLLEIVQIYGVDPDAVWK